MPDPRQVLIEWREAKQLTPEALALKLNVSTKTIRRLESGETESPRMSLRAALAEFYGRSVEDVHRAIRGARNGHSVASHLPHFVSLEQAAPELRVWETLAVNWLLQTRAYAEAVERMADDSEAAVQRRVQFRLDRQRALTRRNPLHLYACLDASVFLRDVGGRGVMREQVEHLRAVNKLPNVDVRVMPMDGHALVSPGTFQILSNDAWEPHIATVESLAGISYLESPDSLGKYLRLWSLLWENARELEDVVVLNHERAVR